MPTDYPPLNNQPLNKEGFWTVPWVMYFAELFGGGSGGGNAPANAEYVLGVANGDLPNARVVTNSNSNVWNLAVAGQAAVSRAALSGDITAPFDGNVTTLSTTGVTPGTYGDATHVGQFTVDAKGRLSFAADVAITFPAAGITQLTGDVLAGPGSGSQVATLRSGVATSVIGRAANSTGAEADIQATLENHVLVRRSSTLGFTLEQSIGYWSPLSNGDPVTPELVWDSFGDTVSVWTAL